MTNDKSKSNTIHTSSKSRSQYWCQWSKYTINPVHKPMHSDSLGKLQLQVTNTSQDQVRPRSSVPHYFAGCMAHNVERLLRFMGTFTRACLPSKTDFNRIPFRRWSLSAPAVSPARRGVPPGSPQGRSGSPASQRLLQPDRECPTWVANRNEDIDSTVKFFSCSAGILY